MSIAYLQSMRIAQTIRYNANCLNYKNFPKTLSSQEGT